MNIHYHRVPYKDERNVQWLLIFNDTLNQINYKQIKPVLHFIVIITTNDNDIVDKNLHDGIVSYLQFYTIVYLYIKPMI